MQIDCIRTNDALGDTVLAGHWNRLAAHSPFASWDWLEAWWRHFAGEAPRGGPSSELLTLAIRDAAGRHVGLVPLYRDRSGWKGGVLRFLGAYGVCTDYLGVLAEPGTESAVAASVAEWLADDVAGQWDLIELDGVDAEDRATHELVHEMKSRGCLINRRAGPSCWRLDLPGDWEAYVAGLSPAHRKRLRRFDRRMFASGRAVLRTVEREQELPAALETLVDLHQKRQLSIGNTGSFASEPFTQFHREVTCRFLRRSLLRLHWLELDGRPVAAEYHVAGSNVVFAYQGGMEPLAIEESPGQLATIATMKRAIAQGFTAYDFLRGDESYKAAWGARPRPSVRLRIVAAHASARIRHGVWVAAKTIKDQLASGFKLAVALQGEPRDA